jgi:hypothetical protein
MAGNLLLENGGAFKHVCCFTPYILFPDSIQPYHHFPCLYTVSHLVFFIISTYFIENKTKYIKALHISGRLFSDQNSVKKLPETMDLQPRGFPDMDARPSAEKDGIEQKTEELILMTGPKAPAAGASARANIFANSRRTTSS